MADKINSDSSATRLKDIFPEIAAKTGVPEKHVAAICRQLLSQIQDTIEKGNVLRSKHLIFRSAVKKNDQQQGDQDVKSQFKVGRVIIKPVTEGKDSKDSDSNV